MSNRLSKRKEENLQAPVDSSPPASFPEVICAPARPPPKFQKTIFLAGTTSSSTDWRTAVVAALSGVPVTILNPLRPDWDSSWVERASFRPFREQVEWEIEMQERADVIVVYFGAGTDAPVSLLEFGLCARSGKAAVVVCEEGYRKRGNVEIVCERYGIQMAADINELSSALRRKLREQGVEA